MEGNPGGRNHEVHGGPAVAFGRNHNLRAQRREGAEKNT